MALYIDLNKNQIGGTVDCAPPEIIEESDRAFWGVTDEELKQYFVSRNPGWKKPDRILVRQPTPGMVHNNKFDHHNQPQTKVNLVFSKAEIIDSSEVMEVVQATTLDNATAGLAELTASLTKTVSSMVSNTWSKSNSIKVGIKAGVKIGIVSGETSFEYSHSWNESTTQQQTVTLGVSSGIKVMVPAKTKILAELRAVRQQYSVKITYDAFLSGVFIAYYNDLYHPTSNDKHRVWFPTIPLQRRKVYETINISGYGRCDIVLTDKSTKEMVGLMPLRGGELDILAELDTAMPLSTLLPHGD